MPDRRRVLALIAASPGLAALDLRDAAAQAADLVARMTLEEKLGQLTLLSADLAVTGPTVAGNLDADLRAGRVGGVFNLWGRDAVRAAQRAAVEETRLGIPLFFGFDVIHGFRTVFPIPLAEAGAFDPALWEATARHAAEEAAAAGLDLVFAPMLDVTRDPRWGRIAEGPGEDPYVAARFAEAKVRGTQGSAGLAATPKHFVAYGASAAGRDYAPVDVSDRALAEVYLPPFKAAVDAGALAIMPAFTDIAGVPMTAQPRAPHRQAPRRMGLHGVVVSDYGAIGELVRHGVAADPAEAAALALNAGVDIDMMSLAYRRGLPQALDRGLATMAAVDAAVARVLALKHRLGLFDDPYRRCAGPDPETPAAPRRPARRRPRRRRPLARAPPEPRRRPAAARPARPHRAPRPARACAGRDARPLGRHRARRGGGERPRRPRGRPAGCGGRARPRRPHRRRHAARHRRRRRRRGPRRPRRPLPRRGRLR